MKIKTSMLVKTAIFVALMVVGAYISVPFGVISFTLQTLFCMMAGMVLGKGYGALSQAIYALLGLIGIPVFTGFTGGLGKVLTPSFGFILGFILMAFVVGFVREKLGGGQSFVKGLVSCLAGTIALYLVGLPYMYIIMNYVMGVTTGIEALMAAGLIPFLLPDAIKIIVSGILGEILRNRLGTKKEK